MSRTDGPLILALASLKGGVGKTTSAVHIAAYLAQKGQRVLLADGDRIRTATTWGRIGKPALHGRRHGYVEPGRRLRRGGDGLARRTRRRRPD